MRPFPGRMPASVLIFLVPLLAALAIRFWAVDKQYEFSGPTHIAHGNGSVFVFVSGDIVQTDREGALTAIFPAAVTRLLDDPIDLAVLPDGALLIAEQDPARIRICQPEPWDCRSLPAALLAPIERQFKVLPGSRIGEYLLTDARGDMLWRLSEESEDLQKLLSPRTLAGPNGLVFGEGENLWIADTDHRRIVEFIASPERIYYTDREHDTVNELTIGQRVFPMMLDRTPDGRLWVAQAAELTENFSDLVVYHPDEGALAVIPLPPAAYATAVAALPGRVLVTDLEGFAIFSVDPDSYAVSEFGDSNLRGHLAELKHSRSHYKRLANWSLIALVAAAVLLVAAAIKATPKDRRWTRPAPTFDLERAPDQVPDVRGIHWLEKNPKTLRVITRASRAFYGLLAALTLGLTGLLAWLLTQAGQAACVRLGTEPFKLGLIALAIFSIPFAMVPVIRASTQAARHAIGTDGRRIHLRLACGHTLSADPAQISYNQRAILCRQHTCPLLAGPNRPLYRDGEIEKWLAPLLRQARQLTEWGILKHQWRNRDRLLLWPAGSIMLLSVIILVLKFYVL